METETLQTECNRAHTGPACPDPQCYKRHLVDPIEVPREIVDPDAYLLREV